MSTRLVTPDSASIPVVQLELNERSAQIALRAYIEAAHPGTIDKRSDPRIRELERVLFKYMKEWVLIAWDGTRGFIVSTQGSRWLESEISEGGRLGFYEYMLGEPPMPPDSPPGLYLLIGTLEWHPGPYEYPQDGETVFNVKETTRATMRDLELMQTDVNSWREYVDDCEDFDTERFFQAHRAQFPDWIDMSPPLLTTEEDKA